MKFPRTGQRCDGFTLFDLVIVILTVGALVMFGLLPRSSTRGRAYRIQCTSHLKQVGLAYREWAQDHGDRYPFYTAGLTNEETGVRISSNAITAEAWMHFRLLSNELSTSTILMCPAERTRFKNAAQDFSTNSNPAGLGHISRRDASISYFVGLGATPQDSEAILGGDRNIAATGTNIPYGVTGRIGVVDVPGYAKWTAAAPYQHHEWMGNVLLADDSVQQVTSIKLQQCLTNAMERYGTNANRFLFPR